MSKKFDGEVEVLQKRMDDIVEEARGRLAADARALVNALEGRTEILGRLERVSDLVVSSTFFSALPVRITEKTPYNNILGVRTSGGGWDIPTAGWDQGNSYPVGEYTLVVALVPRVVLVEGKRR